MSREKQIEEMKSIIDKAEEEYSEIWNEWFYDHKEGTKIDNEFLFFAKMLYDAGYRKASEVASKSELDEANKIIDMLQDVVKEYRASVDKLQVELEQVKSDVAREIRQDIIEPLWEAWKDSESQTTVLLVAMILETIDYRIKMKYLGEDTNVTTNTESEKDK